VPKRIIGLTLAFLAGASLAFGGVVKTTKTEVAFKKFGTFRATITDKITATKKLADTVSEFKGQGVLGTLAAKTILRSGQTGEIVDLPGLTIYQIDHKRKEYTATTLEKWAETQKKEAGGGAEEAKPEEKTESDVRITKSEFKVRNTGETKTINGFACTKYQSVWTIEWENVKTGEKGTDRLETAVWTTPVSDALREAQDEEMKFSRAYLQAVGLDADKLQQDVLGTQWLALLGGFDPAAGGSKMNPKETSVAQEMKKIEGYPIVIDGQYTPAPRIQAAAEEKPSGGGGIGGALGKIGGGLLKKKPKPEEEKAPAIKFYTEVLSLSAAAVDPNELAPPANYKKKG
jgi:hypothetical protein